MKKIFLLLAIAIFVVGCQVQVETNTTNGEDMGVDEFPDYDALGRSGDWCVTGEFFTANLETRTVTSVVLGLDDFRGETLCSSEASLARDGPLGDEIVRYRFYYNEDASNLFVIGQIEREGQSPELFEETYVDGEKQ